MHRNQALFGIVCIAGMLAIMAHSAMLGTGMMGTPPYPLQKAYFEDIEKYSGERVYVFAVAESVSVDRITFINALGKDTEIIVEGTEGVENGTPVFMEVRYDSETGELHGSVLYRLIYGTERIGISAIALAWVLFYYFVLKKRLRIDVRRLKVVVLDA